MDKLDLTLEKVWNNERLLKSNLIGLILECSFRFEVDKLRQICHPKLLELRDMQQDDAFNYIMRKMSLEEARNIYLHHFHCVQREHSVYLLEK